MASTVFIDNQTIIYASWLNDVNDLTYNGVLSGGILNGTTLALQTGGINALTIDSSQNVTINSLVLSGTIAAPSGLTITGNVTSTGSFSANVFKSTGGIYENNQIIASSYSITSGNSASSSGPITLNSGVTVTVPSGSRWVIM